jgi:hypothetical protein
MNSGYCTIITFVVSKNGVVNVKIEQICCPTSEAVSANCCLIQRCILSYDLLKLEDISFRNEFILGRPNKLFMPENLIKLRFREEVCAILERDFEWRCCELLQFV